MSHNDIAAKFRDILRQRGINIYVIPWDSIIYSFAKNNQHMPEKQLISAINEIINETLKYNMP